jgi:hypothetical protein
MPGAEQATRLDPRDLRPLPNSIPVIASAVSWFRQSSATKPEPETARLERIHASPRRQRPFPATCSLIVRSDNVASAAAGFRAPRRSGAPRYALNGKDERA